MPIPFSTTFGTLAAPVHKNNTRGLQTRPIKILIKSQRLVSHFSGKLVDNNLYLDYSDTKG
jgi:hypothetical protein